MKQKVVIAPSYQRLKQDIELLPQRFAAGEGKIIHEGRNQLRLFTLQGIPVMVKRFKRANIFQQFAYTFYRKTKAERAFLFAKSFRERGVETPHEVAYIEQKERDLFTMGYFISDVCPDPPAFPVLVEKKSYDQRLATSVASEIAHLHQAGILHGDLNLGNFLYRQENGQYRFTIVDTNRSKLTIGLPPIDVCLKNLSTVTERPDLFTFIVREYLRHQGWSNREAELLQRAISYWQAKYRYLHRRRHIKHILRKLYDNIVKLILFFHIFVSLINY